MVSKKTDGKITIRGTAYKRDSFKLSVFFDEFDEFGVQHLLDYLIDIGEIAHKGCKNKDDLVRNSPLLYLEGLLRIQLERLDDELPVSLDELESVSDFSHAKAFFHKFRHCPNSKAVFLFDFLNDIVTFSEYPEQIDAQALEKIALNLRTFSFLVESQITGSKKSNDDVFEAFTHALWLKMGAKKISAQQFWNKAITLLMQERHERELEFNMIRRFGGKEEQQPCGIRLTKNKSGMDVLEPFDSTTGKRLGKPKSLRQIQNRWKDLQGKFLKK